MAKAPTTAVLHRRILELEEEVRLLKTALDNIIRKAEDTITAFKEETRRHVEVYHETSSEGTLEKSD